MHPTRRPYLRLVEKLIEYNPCLTSRWRATTLDIDAMPQTAAFFPSRPILLVTPIETTAASSASRAEVSRVRHVAHGPAHDVGSGL